MYEELIQFLLGKKEELTNDDMDEFIELLNDALETTEEYNIYTKQNIIEKIVDHVKITNTDERKVVKQSIDNILHVDIVANDEVDLFDDVSEDSEASVPLRSKKFVRGKKCDDNVSLRSKKFTRKPKDNSNLNNLRVNSSEISKGGLEKYDDISDDSVKHLKLNETKHEQAHDSIENSSLTEQEDILKSMISEAATPQNTVKSKTSQKIYENEIHKNSKSESSDDYKFEVGELEEDCDKDCEEDGQEVAFNTEETE